MSVTSDCVCVIVRLLTRAATGIPEHNSLSKKNFISETPDVKGTPEIFGSSEDSGEESCERLPVSSKNTS